MSRPKVSITPEYISEYIRLIDLFARVNDDPNVPSDIDVDERERLIHAHNLANKFLFHALTILHLTHGTVLDLPSFDKHIHPDSASIEVLTRAAMEAFLIFHFVFYAPKAKEERDFRYWSYRAAGLAERQNIPEATDEHRQTKKEDKKVIDELQIK